MEEKTTYYENPVQFSRDWADRLRKAKPLDDLSDNPIMGADNRYIQDIGKTFQEAQRQFSSPDFGFRPSDDVTERLSNLFFDRQSYLKSLGGDEVKSFGERLKDFEQRTGASFSNLSGQDFGGVRHETISHLLPYDKGFSADYSDKLIRGQRIGSSPISPLNERLATWNDIQLDLPSKLFTFNRLFGGDELNPLYDAQGEYAAGLSDIGRKYTKSELNNLTPDQRNRLRLFESTSNNTNPFLFPSEKHPNRMRPFMPSSSLITQVEAQTALNLNEAQRLYEMKFTEPLRRRFNNLGLVQAPSEISRNFHIPLGRGLTDAESLLYGSGGKEFREFRGLSVDETPYTRLQNLSKNLEKLGRGRLSGRSGAENLLFATDPVTASLEGARRLVGKNPRGAVAGAAASLLNPEVAQALSRDDYNSAGKTVARDIAVGAVTEAGLKQAAARLPAAAAVLNSSAARLLGPVATGVALLSQGQKGSLTDVITRKAAENPIPFTPRAKPDPKTDVGRMAGNELQYMFGQLTRGRLPYFN